MLFVKCNTKESNHRQLTMEMRKRRRKTKGGEKKKKKKKKGGREWKKELYSTRRESERDLETLGGSGGIFFFYMTDRSMI